MRTLDDIVQQGKARYVGVSNFRLAQLEACMRLRRIDVVQYGWNMFDRRMQREIFPWCTAHDVGVMAYGSLAYGMLSGAFHADMRFDEADWRSKGGALGAINLFRTMFSPEHFPRNLRAVEELKSVAARYGRTLPQFALAWTLSNRAIHTGLVGFRRPAEVDENLGALGVAIAPDDMARIDAIFTRHDVITEPPGWLEDEPTA
jgi:myo-inositol catabolism protein IolS